MVGWESCFGMVINILIALCFSSVPCGFGPNMCAYDTFDCPYFEQFDQFLSVLRSNRDIALLVFVAIISTSFYNLNGVRIVKLFDSLTRSLLNITRTTVIWVLSIIETAAADSAEYQL